MQQADGIPTIMTPKGSAKPESDANLNACHLLTHPEIMPEHFKIIIQK